MRGVWNIEMNLISGVNRFLLLLKFEFIKPRVMRGTKSILFFKFQKNDKKEMNCVEIIGNDFIEIIMKKYRNS